MKTVSLYRRGLRLRDEVALVDDEKLGKVTASGPWYVYRGSSGILYPCIYPSRHQCVLMHQILVDFVPDHADGNGLNNQLLNLRDATKAQNAANSAKQSGCASAYKGVKRDGPGWGAQIWVAKKYRYLGYFGQDEIAAARAYNDAALEAWGEFARLNILPAPDA